jgi:hypothetical protein
MSETQLTRGERQRHQHPEGKDDRGFESLHAVPPIAPTESKRATALRRSSPNPRAEVVQQKEKPRERRDKSRRRDSRPSRPSERNWHREESRRLYISRLQRFSPTGLRRSGLTMTEV